MFGQFGEALELQNVKKMTILEKLSKAKTEPAKASKKTTLYFDLSDFRDTRPHL